MEFGTSIHCMDGRIQEPLVNFIKNEFNITYVDAITEAGPCKILPQNSDQFLIESLKARIAISLNQHNSKMIFISGHHDCAGNPASKDEQLRHIAESAAILRAMYPHARIVELWIDENWTVHMLSARDVES
jgi:hypothetical protein